MRISLLALLGIAAATSCSTARTVATPSPTPVPQKAVSEGSYAGFDKRDFPGLDQMSAWMRESPYIWTGYYLASPCFGGRTWTGQREQLLAQGWGLAVIYVGQQAPSASMLTGEPNVTAADVRSRVCAQNALTAAQGVTDADQAVDMSAADGFPRWTTIFLDVERTPTYPPALNDYVRAWVDRVLARGYLPGIYAHKTNAAALFATVRSAYAAASETRPPGFWIANSVGFDFGKRPAESGFDYATIWQNPSDASESHGGVTFRVDRNVATTRSPSTPR